MLTAVAISGMRSITFAQAFQFWLKLTALLVPAIAVLSVWHAHHDRLGNGYPTVPRATTVHVGSATSVRVPVTETLRIDGVLDGQPVAGPVPVPAGKHHLGADTRVELRAGDVVPVVTSLPAQRNADWLRPLGSGKDHPLYATLSLLLAICLGTMGLPHVLVRFYTNPDGRDARRTTLAVIILLSAFYLLPTVFGAFGRRYVPDLLLTGDTDATVLLLPERMVAGLPGTLLGALVTAGAFAAFLSTSSGLTVSVAGVLSQDVIGGRRERTRARRIRAFRLSAIVAIGVPYALSLPSERIGLAAVVGLAFAVAASSFSPLLVLGIWWRRLTDAGTVAGLASGGLLATIAVLITIFGGAQHGWAGALLEQPAAWAVPLAFGVMVGVSLLTPRRVPADTARVMVRLHAPESLDLTQVRPSPAPPAAPPDSVAAYVVDRSSPPNDRSSRDGPPLADASTTPTDSPT